MKTTTRIQTYLGHQIDDPTEEHVLGRLQRDLEDRGISVRILANFVAGPRFRQIDLLIVTPLRAVHCELKGYTLPVMGGANGPWQQVLPDGRLRALDGNPYRQAQDGTYALSDELHSFARHTPRLANLPGGRFFKQIDTVVCIYPIIPHGSQLARYPYVDVVDYNGLLARLMQRGPHLEWSSDDWDGFTLHLGLYRPDERPREEQEREVERTIVEDYRRRFIAAHGAELHELVPISARIEGEDVPQPDVRPLIAAQRDVVVLGPSGIGKSHLVAHAALDLVREGHVAIWFRCGEYEAGKFGMSLARAIAPFVTEPALKFIHMANRAGSLVTLVLDGLNECPEALRSELLQQVSALRLRAPVGVIITTQQPLSSLPETFADIEVRLAVPSTDERLAVLRSYGAEHLAPVSDALATPFELALAATCAAELVEKKPNRTELLDAYVRHCSGSTRVRAALRHIAGIMDDRLRLSLPVADVMLALERYPGGALSADIVDAVLNCRLLQIRHGRIAFAHELFARFLAAENLVLQSEDGVALGNALGRAHHTDLRHHAAALERDHDRLREAVMAVADTDVMVAAIKGELGVIAQDVVISMAASLLAEATFVTTRSDIQIVRGSGMSDYTWRLPRSWSGGERALFSAIGRCLHDGLFVEEVGLLVQRTDELCATHLKELRAAGDRQPITSLVASVYGLPWTDERNCLPASLVIRACQQHPQRWPTTAHNSIRVLVDRSDLQSWGRLYLAALLLNPCHAEDVTLIASLLAKAWAAQGYHLRLQALDMARYAVAFLGESMQDDVKEDIRTVLAHLETPNWMLDSTLIEVKAAYGMVEPAADLDEICGRIATLLAHEDNPDAWSVAHNVVMSQFEDEAVLGPYSEAMSRLSAPDYRRLLVMAAHGSSPEDLGTQWLLQTLIDTGGLNDPRTREVFIHFASQVDPSWLSAQQGIATHLAALRGCARFCDRPPCAAEDSESAEQRAWSRVDELLFELERPAAGMPVQSRSADIWKSLHGELAHAAVDVLHQLRIAAGVSFDPKEATPHARFIACYRDEVRILLEWGLTHRDLLTSHFRPGHSYGRDDYIVRTLGIVGNTSTGVLLRRYVQAPSLGEAAAAAVWQLERVGDGSS